MQINNRKIVKISKKKFILLLVLIIIAFIVFGVFKLLTNTYSTSSSSPTMNYPMMEDSISTSKSVMPVNSDYYRGNGQQGSIVDSREFLKTSYTGNIKTRDVAGVVNNVKNIIKGADGRIDNFYSSEKGGQISFVIAKSKFDDFQNQIKGLVNAKLYTETISSQNLLNQKQNIEQQTNDVVTSLDGLNKQKDALNTKHTQTLASINKELLSIRSQLIVVRKLVSTTTDAVQLASLRDQETILMNNESIQLQKINTENNNYQILANNLKASIDYQNANLTNVNKQDTQFTNNIETVNGYVYVNWISYWQMADIFSPISPIIIVIVLIIALWIFLGRIGFIPKFVFV